MDLVELLFRTVGAFYLFAGHTAVRAMLTSAVADRMIATLTTGSEPARISGRDAAQGIAVVLTATSGVALVLMSGWALPLFIANVVVQAALLTWPRTYSSAPGDGAATGRRRTANAALIYATVALGVTWLWRDGRLGPLDDPVAVGLMAATAMFFIGRMGFNLGWEPGRTGVFDDPDLPRETGHRPSRVRLDPCFGSWPLVDVERDCRFNHLTWLPEDLAFRVEDWDDEFQVAFDPDDPAASPDFGTAASAARYIEEGRAIVLALCDHFGADNVEVSETFDRSA